MANASHLKPVSCVRFQIKNGTAGATQTIVIAWPKRDVMRTRRTVFWTGNIVLSTIVALLTDNAKISKQLSIEFL